MRYQKRPLIIDAIRWMGDNEIEILSFVADPECRHVRRKNDKILIETLEGTMAADIGAWIIRGVKGELYPCANDVFQETYEAVA